MIIFYIENNNSWLEFHIRINPIADMFIWGMKIIVCVCFGQTDCTLTLSRRGTCQMKSCSVCGSKSAGPANVEIHVSLSN